MTSPARPIVLLRRLTDAPVAPSVTQGLDSIGVMLPYAPIHHVLFDHLAASALVMTSGNLSDEPIAIENSVALERLGPIAVGVLHHNRAIHNRADDSVAAIVSTKPRLLRRSRGYVPTPIKFACDVEGIAAVGGELKNTFCIGKGDEVILSQHIGDLKTPETYEYFCESFERLSRLFRFEPTLISCDLHPDYLSTRFAEATGVPVVRVQHHHAHIAAALAESGLRGPAIGVAFDGTGFGEDGNTWGGEFLIADTHGFERVAHIDYIPLPGGDEAVHEPWRTAIALLLGADRRDLVDRFFADRGTDAEFIVSMIDRRVRTPLSSGVGRLFDGVAALCGIAAHARYEAEGPMLLESALRTEWYTAAPYPIETASIGDSPRPHVIGWGALIDELALDVLRGVAIEEVSARFHRWVAEVVLSLSEQIRQVSGLETVVLSGGVFQNRKLLSHVESILERRGFTLIRHASVPANDGGICLGQLAVAASRRTGAGSGGT